MGEEKRMLDIGGAIAALKDGKKVTRKGWNGKDMFLWMKPGTEIKSDWCKDPELKKLADDNGGTITGLPTVCMYACNGGKRVILSGWLASQIDLFAEDWEVLEDK